MSHVVLINTKIAKKESASDTSLTPPLNILRIASILVERGYKVKLIDQRVEEDWKKELKRYLNKGAICAGISSLSGIPIKFGLEASKICKDYGVKTVWGGVHPTLEPYTTIKNEHVDLVVKGEGEFTFFNLVDSLERRKKLNNIKGILFKTDGKIKETPNSPPIDLNILPNIPFDLLNLDNYEIKFHHKKINFEGLTLPLETSRGCTHSCRFCSKIHRGFKVIDIDRIIDELRYIKDNFTRNAIFIDENFFVDHKRVKKFLDLIKRERIDMNFCGVPRIDYISKNFNILNKLERGGFRTLILSGESGSQRMLNFLDKKLQIKDICEANKKLKKTDITINYSFMVGLPYETIEDIKKTFMLALKLLLENKNARIGIARFMPTPGVEIIKDCIELGFKKPNTLEEWANFNSYRWQPKYPWISDELQEFLEKFNYIQGLCNLRNYSFPLTNQILELFGNLMKIRIKNEYYKFNFEQKLGELFSKIFPMDATRL